GAAVRLERHRHSPVCLHMPLQGGACLLGRHPGHIHGADPHIVADHITVHSIHIISELYIHSQQGDQYQPRARHDKETRLFLSPRRHPLCFLQAPSPSSHMSLPILPGYISTVPQIIAEGMMDVATIAKITIMMMTAMIRLVRLLLKFMSYSPFFPLSTL